jgi:hypothetical protein
VYVSELESAFGAPSRAGFGSAVFFEPRGPDSRLSDAALAKYRYFVGDLWQRYGEAAWMKPWKRVYGRSPGAARDIQTELRAISDRDAAVSVSMVLDATEDPARARAALAAAFDDPAVTELEVFRIGDGQALSGLVVAGRRSRSGETTLLVFLMD